MATHIPHYGIYHKIGDVYYLVIIAPKIFAPNVKQACQHIKLLVHLYPVVIYKSPAALSKTAYLYRNLTFISLPQPQ
jgi:hypothetical protein